MEKEITFEKLLNHICSRPRMWVPKGTFNEVYSLITGYTMGKEDTPLSGDKWTIFNKYVCIKFGFSTKYLVSYVLKSFTSSDEEAINLLEVTINEFAELQKEMTSEQILEYAAASFKQEEGEPEKIFRIFDKALLNCDKETIKSLIVEHEHQNILWDSAFPDDVGNLLNQISESQPIKRVFESEDKTKVQLISSDYTFPFEMNFNDGNWKIDASPLINLRMIQNKEKNKN